MDSVITVHGIRDDYKTAWTDQDGMWWLRGQLFEKLSVRQVDYSYEVEDNSSIYGPEGIQQHAQSLVTEYAKFRKELEAVGAGFLSGRHILNNCTRLRLTVRLCGYAMILEASSSKRYVG